MKALIYIAVVFSSMLGAQFFGVSLNKIALIPLEIALLTQINRKSPTKFHMSKAGLSFIQYYAANILAALSGCLFASLYIFKDTDIYIKNIYVIIQILFIYLPIAFLFWNNSRKVEYAGYMKKALVFDARLQACWGILQFALYYSIQFDLNEYFFNEMFNGMLGGGSSWTALNNIGGTVLLRVTGLNHDAAFLGLLLCIGLILEKSLIWRIVYVSCAMLSFSRSALVTMAASLLVTLVIKAKKQKYIRPRLLIRNFLILAVCGIVLVFLYRSNVHIQNGVERVLARFGTIATGEDGTGRHTGYFWGTLSIWLTDIPVIQKLFGVGGGVGGVLLGYYADSVRWLDLSSFMKSGMGWAVESDLSNILLGTGIVGFFLYYYFLYKTMDKNNTVKLLITFCIAIFGIMYNVSGTTLTQLVFICLMCDNKCSLALNEEADREPLRKRAGIRKARGIRIYLNRGYGSTLPLRHARSGDKAARDAT